MENKNSSNAKIKSVQQLLDMPLFIPDYQRPYKWTISNVADLLTDIDNAMSDNDKYDDFKYRIGTIILHKENEGKYNIVDGQQRVLTLILIMLYLDDLFTCNLLNHTNFSNKDSQYNLNSNYSFIKDYFSLKTLEYKERVKETFKSTLEIIVIEVFREAEAFQLFDSQNTRGKALDPHDLLKAYHLREMSKYPYEMQHAVTKWEAVDTKEVRELFELYLFPIRQWSNFTKSFNFTAKDIDIYKGISENSPYTYAKRASKAMPYFQIAEPFIAGNDFFEMVDHYLRLIKDIKTEISDNKAFEIIKSEIEKNENKSAGFKYAENLFYCSVLCYYDKFRNFDEQVIKKLFTWAFMLRVDMRNLGFDSVNKYAIGERGNAQYTNIIPMFAKIREARMHSQIANVQITVLRNSNTKWTSLYETIKLLNGHEIEEEKSE